MALGGKDNEFALFLSVAPLARLSGDAQEKQKEKKERKERWSHLSEESPPRGATRRLYTWRLSFCALPLARAHTRRIFPVPCASTLCADRRVQIAPKSSEASAYWKLYVVILICFIYRRVFPAPSASAVLVPN